LNFVFDNSNKRFGVTVFGETDLAVGKGYRKFAV
jgi:hypothetical protein